MAPAFLTTFLFAISAVAANRTTRRLGGVTANFFRITIATLLLAVWAHTFGGGFHGKALPYLIVSGTIGFGLGDLAFYQTLPRLGSRLSIVLVHCLAAPLAAAVEWLWMGTRLTEVQIASSITILAGVALALAPGKHLHLPRRVLVTGVLFGCGAAIGQSMGAVLSRRAYQVAAASGEQIDGLTAAYQRILAGWFIAAFMFALARMRASSQPSCDTETASKPIWPWILLNALSGPTLGVGCFQWALATSPTGLVLPIIATTPIVVIPFARLVEGERPRLRSLVGGVIAALGAIALSASPRWTHGVFELLRHSR